MGEDRKNTMVLLRRRMSNTKHSNDTNCQEINDKSHDHDHPHHRHYPQRLPQQQQRRQSYIKWILILILLCCLMILLAGLLQLPIGIPTTNTTLWSKSSVHWIKFPSIRRPRRRRRLQEQNDAQEKQISSHIIPTDKQSLQLLQGDDFPQQQQQQPSRMMVVNCTEWIQWADENADDEHNKKGTTSPTTTTTTTKASWTDPYHGKILIPYTLPKPAPSHLQIGLYGKEVQFVEVEVHSKSSHVRHSGQGIWLTILQEYIINHQKKYDHHHPHYNNNKDMEEDRSNPIANVIQVGGQIGWFSIQAAAIGGGGYYDVHILEENPSHILRTCRNVQLNAKKSDDGKNNNNNKTTKKKKKGNAGSSIETSIHLYHTTVMAGVVDGTTNNNDSSTTTGTTTTTTTTSLASAVDLTGRLGRGVFAHQVEFVPGMINPIYPSINNNIHSRRGKDDDVPLLLPIPSTSLDTWAVSHSMLLDHDDVHDSKEHDDDDYHHRPIVLLKIDVAQGRETQVIHSAYQLLQSKRVLNIIVDMEVGLNPQQQQQQAEGTTSSIGAGAGENFLHDESHPHRQLIELLLDCDYLLNNKWNKTNTISHPIFFPESSLSSLLLPAATDNNTNNAAKREAILHSILKLVGEFCGQAAKGCHMWWKLGIDDSS